MSFEQATLVPNEEELLDQEIARAQAELEVVSNRLQRPIQLRRLNEDTEAATQVLDKLASDVAAACGNGYGSRIMKAGNDEGGPARGLLPADTKLRQ